MKEFVNGVVFGILLIIVLVFYLIYKTRAVPVPNIVGQEWPKELEAFLKKQLSADINDLAVGDTKMSPTMDIAWVNLIFTRLFLSSRSSSLYKSMIKSISYKMNANLKKGLLVSK